MADKHGVDLVDGKLRRAGPGVRTFSDFFKPEVQGRPVTRAELLNILGTFEHARLENVWWKRLRRWLMGAVGREVPAAKDYPFLLAQATKRQLADVEQRLTAAQTERDMQESLEADNIQRPRVSLYDATGKVNPDAAQAIATSLPASLPDDDPWWRKALKKIPGRKPVTPKG